MTREYLEQRDGGYYLIGSRVSLESVIHSFLEGASPETIMDDFPSLSLEEISGAITFYLANREMIDGYLADGKKLWQEAHGKQPPAPHSLKQRLERARREMQLLP